MGGKYLSTNRRLEYTAPQIEIYDLDRDTLYVDWTNPHQTVDPATFIYNNCLYMIYGAIPPILNRLQAYPLFGSKTDIIHI